RPALPGDAGDRSREPHGARRRDPDQDGQALMSEACDPLAFAAVAAALAGTDAIRDELLEAARSHLETVHGAAAVARFVDAVIESSIDALDADSEAMAQALLKILYTGQIGPTAPQYRNALAWESLEFATAPGACGSAFGA